MFFSNRFGRRQQRAAASNNNNYDTTGISKVGTCKGELKQVKLGPPQCNLVGTCMEYDSGPMVGTSNFTYYNMGHWIGNCFI